MIVIKKIIILRGTGVGVFAGVNAIHHGNTRVIETANCSNEK